MVTASPATRSLLISPRQSLLRRIALLYIGLAGVFLLLSLVDSRQVLGINAWIKPFKFAVAISIYAFTLDWLLSFSDLSGLARRKVVRLTIVSMLTEIILIAGQSARGQQSHFNTTTALNGMIFSLMGIMIMVNTGVVVYLAIRFFKQKSIPGFPPAFLWSIRAALFIFLVACFEGGFMSAQPGHTVGAADGGAGLPLVNWSTTAGDLRIAHFIGLHALQVLPLLTFWLIRRGRTPSVRTVLIGATAYLLFSVGLFIWALLGLPVYRA